MLDDSYKLKSTTNTMLRAIYRLIKGMIELLSFSEQNFKIDLPCTVPDFLEQNFLKSDKSKNQRPPHVILLWFVFYQLYYLLYLQQISLDFEQEMLRTSAIAFWDNVLVWIVNDIWQRSSFPHIIIVLLTNNGKLLSLVWSHSIYFLIG